MFRWGKQNIKPSTAIQQVSPHRLLTHYSFGKVLWICFKLPFPTGAHFQCALTVLHSEMSTEMSVVYNCSVTFIFLMSESKITWMNNCLKYFLQNNSVMDPPIILTETQSYGSAFQCQAFVCENTPRLCDENLARFTLETQRRICNRYLLIRNKPRSFSSTP